MARKNKKRKTMKQILDENYEFGSIHWSEDIKKADLIAIYGFGALFLVLIVLLIFIIIS